MDLYLDFKRFYQRLENDYKRFGNLVIAYDFDDTVYDTHKRGATYTQVISLLRRWRPYAKFIVWTVSPPERFDFIRYYLTTNDIPYDTINENIHPPDSKIPEARKIYANIYLDDRGGLMTAFTALKTLISKIENDELH